MGTFALVLGFFVNIVWLFLPCQPVAALLPLCSLANWKEKEPGFLRREEEEEKGTGRGIEGERERETG